MSYGKRKKIFLSIVYYPETKVDFHAPEGCLAGQGIQISKTAKTIYITHKERKVKINLNQLVRKNNNSNELIYYFYKAGDFHGKSYIRLRLALAMNKFSTKEKSGALIRISTPALNSDYQPASENLISFIAELYPYLIKHL
ncbi:MAG: EpsI family protein [Patescibacteria group bacterium]|nr:EpsI family protein [Patescibacteria group bacterium]